MIVSQNEWKYLQKNVVDLQKNVVDLQKKMYLSLRSIYSVDENNTSGI